MNQLTPGHIIDNQVELLLAGGTPSASMPSAEAMAAVMQKVSNAVFYDMLPQCNFADDRLRRLLYAIYFDLAQQVALARNDGDEEAAKATSLDFISRLFELRHLLFTDVEAIMHNDPAALTMHEVVASYPAVKALLHYRMAHMLLKAEVPMLPRLITELAHSATGIDIHPGAEIGEYFAIDHGTGVVIGQTCIIGRHVTIYQGVTLGAKNFEYDSEGHPLNVPRHPIIEDNVTIYSNTSILGRITVGHHTVVGGNVWLTHSVEPYSRVLQTSAVNESI